jgi:hypothetical protein
MTKHKPSMRNARHKPTPSVQCGMPRSKVSRTNRLSLHATSFNSER